MSNSKTVIFFTPKGSFSAVSKPIVASTYVAGFFKLYKICTLLHRSLFVLLKKSKIRFFPIFLGQRRRFSNRLYQNLSAFHETLGEHSVSKSGVCIISRI